MRKILLKCFSVLLSADFFRNGKTLGYEVCVDVELCWSSFNVVQMVCFTHEEAP